ncbi:MAG TPA: ascorbate-dependent monooxygenase [Thermoanaerobaculia bacterium]|nr:ascorbate-dependent monooxygenase [Thermoanaerobaculia bacterium]
MRFRVLFLALAVALPLFAKQRVVRHPAPGAGTPTFSREIVRIFQQHCQTCHHAGDIAPFPLVSYSDAKPRASMIKVMTQIRHMPPWKAADGCGDFRDERRLTTEEIATIAKWADAGAPEGNRADLPAPVTFSNAWELGTPDLVLANDESFTPELGKDTYRCFTVPTNTTSEKWVRAVDTHPGDRSTVHHVLTFIDTTGESQRLDEAEPGPGYTCFGGPGFTTTGSLGGWAPGQRALELPENVAFRLPAGSRVVMQVHYHPHTLTPMPDRTAYGLYFSDAPSPKELRFLPIVNQSFTIPPNNSNYLVNGDFPFPLWFAVKIWLVAPHMHLLGKKMEVFYTPPNSTEQCLIRIDDWDFNWQGSYRYENPIDVPAGTRLGLRAWYDNSSSNIRNPNSPPKPVSWGEATTDEMCLAFVGVTIE